jgi:predicted DNA-binding protein (MmcQ/YjbR family)
MQQRPAEGAKDNRDRRLETYYVANADITAQKTPTNAVFRVMHVRHVMYMHASTAHDERSIPLHVAVFAP